MKQMPFKWREQGAVEEQNKVVSETKTIEAVIALMASALVEIVRGAEQTEGDADER